MAAAFDTCVARRAFRDTEAGLLELRGWLDAHIDALRHDPGDD